MNKKFTHLISQNSDPRSNFRSHISHIRLDLRSEIFNHLALAPQQHSFFYNPHPPHDHDQIYAKPHEQKAY